MNKTEIINAIKSLLEEESTGVDCSLYIKELLYRLECIEYNELKKLLADKDHDQEIFNEKLINQKAREKFYALILLLYTLLEEPNSLFNKDATDLSNKLGNLNPSKYPKSST